jgi:hypothetical protein
MAKLFSDSGEPKPTPTVARVPRPAPKVQEPPPPPPAKVFLIEVLNGAKRSQEKFDQPQQ